MEEIRFDGLSFRYPLSEQDALKNIRLTILPSQFVVLCGKSGCGKSTFLRQIKPELTPYGERSGAVYYGKVEISTLSQRTSACEIGYVLQNPDAQIVTDTVWHELAFGLENLGLPNAVIKHRVAEMANYFRIQTWFHKQVSTLSGGQKQLLNLAAVMAMQPSVLVLDEPTSQLDPIAASEFLTTLKRLHTDFGTTIILSEHRLEEAFPLADTVIVLDKGEVFTSGTPSEVGAALYRNGDPHPMFWGLPSMMRLFQQCGLGDLPLTVQQGRNQLQQYPLNIEPTITQEIPHQTLSSASLALKDVWFRYERNSLPVLKSLSLALYAGEWFSILGGNGVGKSTALKIICGELKPQMGKRLLYDQCSIALVPQDPLALFTEITVEEELFEGLSHLALSQQEKLDQTEEMLALMELTELRSANPYDLSGGEQQRLAIGKVLLCRPNILLLDEPTKGLDPFFKRTLADILHKLTAQGISICMVSHDVDFCAENSTRCGLFFDGELVSIGSPTDFFAENYFYTTSINKLLRPWNRKLITCEEGCRWLQNQL